MDEDEGLLASLWGDAEEHPDPKRPRSAPTQAAAAANLDITVEPHSGIRIKPHTRKLSREDINSIASQFAVRKIADLPQHFRGATAETKQVDWVTIGVLAKKKVSKTSESGRTFHVWEISDIKPGFAAKSFSLFLSGDAAANAYKELEGALLLLINPALMPPKDGSGGGRAGGGGGSCAADTGLTFKVDSAQCVKRIGEATQYGMCTFQRPDWSSPCGQWLNTSEGDACGRCAYAKQLERAASARGRRETQRSSGDAAPMEVPAPLRSWTEEQALATLRPFLRDADLDLMTSKVARKHMEEKLGVKISKGDDSKEFARLCLSVTTEILKKRKAAAPPPSDNSEDETIAPISQRRISGAADGADDAEVVVTRTTTAAQVTDADDVMVTSVRTREERHAELTLAYPYPYP